MACSFGASRLAGLLLPAAACALRMDGQGNPEGASTDIAAATPVAEGASTVGVPVAEVCSIILKNIILSKKKLQNVVKTFRTTKSNFRTSKSKFDFVVLKSIPIYGRLHVITFAYFFFLVRNG